MTTSLLHRLCLISQVLIFNLLVYYKPLINFNFHNYNLQQYILSFVNTVRLCFLNLLHLVKTV